MHLYDTLIIGSGYSAAGYALTKKNCIICEESQCCDTHFYLPLKSFIYNEHTPGTQLGKQLCEVFDKYKLFKNGFMCTNAFEPAFCEFLSSRNTNILLKCKVVKSEKQSDGHYKVTVYTNEGLSDIYAKNVFDTANYSHNSKKYITVLYITEKQDGDVNALSNVFTDSVFTKAFYENRFAMHVPFEGICDVNEMMCSIHDRWLIAKTDAKILYIAPKFFTLEEKASDIKTSFPCDFSFDNPIAAFEEGIFFAGGDRQ